MPPNTRGAVDLYKMYRDSHLHSDTDNGPLAIHHTLGNQASNAAPGNHLKHVGGGTISGSRGGNAAVLSLVQALVQLGFTDATTP